MASISKSLWFTAIAAIAAATGADAASVTNKDATSQTIIVDDGGGRSAITIPAGESADFCANGCLVTFPDGESEALTGAEMIEITATSVSIR